MARDVTLLSPSPSRAAGTAGEFARWVAPLWPVAEPWPVCAEPDHYEPLSTPVGPAPVAMVPVGQLYARDVPALVFPSGPDLLQIPWCPLDHEDDNGDDYPVKMGMDVKTPQGATTTTMDFSELRDQGIGGARRGEGWSA
ncbi:hypothetical protein ACIQU6_28505 [Streptomyces sp. NPDC090442]|uniref:hypothetical protein n=1 Tax=Streptomyces sp. NPDC090442 TaxID=3365962 RepID=UPI003820BFDC